MNVIQANCRDRLRAGDIDFIASVLSKDKDQSRFLTDLLSDLETRDLILDDVQLVQAIQDRPECLAISTHLYFYLLVRNRLQTIGMDDRKVADYVAEVLAEFSALSRVRRPLPRDSFSSEYLVDMMAKSAASSEEGRFILTAHIGNYALFITGLYPDRIAYRKQRRGAPDLDYYETLGRSNFETASRLRLAGEYELTSVLQTLGQWFHQVRLALNDLAERVLFVGDRGLDLRFLVSRPQAATG